MGHRRNPTTYKLVFGEESGSELDGLEITTRGPTAEHLFIIASLGKSDVFSLMEGDTMDKLQKLIHAFPDRMIDWNHEDENGNPLAATAENFLYEDHSFVIPVVKAWMLTIRQDPKNQRQLEEYAQEGAQSPADTDENALTDLAMLNIAEE